MLDAHWSTLYTYALLCILCVIDLRPEYVLKVEIKN